MSKMSRGTVAVGVLAVLTLGLSPNTALAKPQPQPPAECSPDVDQFNDSLTIDNEWYPLAPGQTSVFFGFEDGDEGPEPLGLRITVLRKTETFYSDGDPIVTRVVEELEWADANKNGKVDGGEEKFEVSRNYFAQTDAGAVCYFGEDVKIYEDGKFRGDTGGSWRADENGNAPGMFMPAVPQVGQKFQTEFAPPDTAMDTAKIEEFLAWNEFPEAMRVTDCNPIDGDCGTKFYAKDVGLIQDGPVELTKFVSGL